MSLRSLYKYIDEHFNITAPLYNWRHMLDESVDFQAFKEKFLAPTGEHANSIICASKCPEECRIRQIIHDDEGKIKAECRKRSSDFFYLDINEIAIYKLETKKWEALEIQDKHPVQDVFPFAKHHIHKEVDGESEMWYVDGKLRKVYGPKKKNCMQSKILNILYNQIGNGWIPHETFIYATGWTAKEYWGTKRNVPGYMQQQLRHIRKFLGVKIKFNKGAGIKFSEEVVN
jgi:hypothetical protein